MDWFLFDSGLRHERVNQFSRQVILKRHTHLNKPATV